jgi:hypothetical protein
VLSQTVNAILKKQTVNTAFSTSTEYAVSYGCISDGSIWFSVNAIIVHMKYMDDLDKEQYITGSHIDYLVGLG